MSPTDTLQEAAQTAFIPTLTLEISGSATMALMLGALMIQGSTPGPAVITEHPRLFWGVVVSIWPGNVLLVTLNLPLIRIWVTMLKVPYRWLYPVTSSSPAPESTRSATAPRTLSSPPALPCSAMSL